MDRPENDDVDPGEGENDEANPGEGEGEPHDIDDTTNPTDEDRQLMVIQQEGETIGEDHTEALTGDEDEMVTHVTIVRTLDCGLNDAEKIALGDEIAEELKQVQETEAVKDARNKELGAQIKEHTAKAQAAAATLREGTIPREVPCRERWDYRVGTLTVIRLDTREVILERAMSEQERQMGMKF